MSDLLRIRPVDIDDWHSSLSDVVSDMHGRPLEIHSLLANNAPLLRAWWPLRKHVVDGGALGARNAELVILRTAVHARCWYEWASHVVRGLQAGLSLTEILRIASADAGDWSDADRALLVAVDEIEGSGAIGRSALEKLGAHFDRRQVLDLIAVVGTYRMLGCLLNSWEIELDEHVRAALPASVTRQSFEAGLATID